MTHAILESPCYALTPLLLLAAKYPALPCSDSSSSTIIHSRIPDFAPLLHVTGLHFSPYLQLISAFYDRAYEVGHKRSAVPEEVASHSMRQRPERSYSYKQAVVVSVVGKDFESILL